MPLKIATKIINENYRITQKDAEYLTSLSLDKLTSAADMLKKAHSKNNINLCSIINGKNGNCSENCKFCAQSAHSNTSTAAYGFMPVAEIVSDCIKHAEAGVHRYSIVTAGKALRGEDFEKALKTYAQIHEKCPQIELCASMGLIDREQLERLKQVGVTRYHCNLETSEDNFASICTTHTFADKINTLKNARAVGLEICSGGIIGMGESMRDRLDMAFSLREIMANSIPINILKHIKNTPFENVAPLNEEEILRTIAIFRFINPNADIRIAAGRNYMKNNGLSAFTSGADSTITGDFLTTTGSTIKTDIEMFKANNFTV